MDVHDNGEEGEIGGGGNNGVLYSRYGAEGERLWECVRSGHGGLGNSRSVRSVQAAIRATGGLMEPQGGSRMMVLQVSFTSSIWPLQRCECWATRGWGKTKTDRIEEGEEAFGGGGGKVGGRGTEHGVVDE